MRISDRALVLQSIKHGDKKLILKIFTREQGLVTVGVNPVKSGKAGIRQSAVMPPNFIEAEILFKQNRDIHLLTEASCYQSYSEVHQNMSKLGIAQFIREVLVKVLKEQQGNPQLFDFLEGCFGFLNDSEEGYGNLHLYFLIELSKYLGFEPQNNYSNENCSFDFREGQFSGISLVWPLGLGMEASQLLADVLNSEVLKYRLSRSQKHLLLDSLVNYYGFHIPNFGNIKSLEVLKDVFSA